MKCVFEGYETDEKNNKYPRFWESGGSCWFDDNWYSYCNEGEWEIYEDRIPKKYRGIRKIQIVFLMQMLDMDVVVGVYRNEEE